MTKTILFSDTHFGYKNININQFTGFLSYIGSSNADRIIILGDMLELWRADPVFTLSAAWPFLEKLRIMNLETHYVIGNHDYHIWNSCPKPKKEFLWLNIHYPYYVFDNTFMIHGDYFDIYNYGQVIPKESIYAIYEAIYLSSEPMVGLLEQFFYNPIKLLMKWIELYKKKPKKEEIEFRRMEAGIRYLERKPDISVQLFVPAYARTSLETEIKALTKRPMSQSSRKALRAIDTSAAFRAQLFVKSPLDLAKEISGKDINNVIYGHTHKVENNASKGLYNVGAWVEGESTFAEIENGHVRICKFQNGNIKDIPPT